MARTARRVPVLGAIRPICVVRWNNQAQCQESRVHTGEWRQSSTRETSSLRSADYNGCAHPTGHLYTLGSLRTAARIFIILYTGQFYGKASSHFKVSFRLGNFNDHFVGKPTSVLRARAFVTLLRTCAVPNKLRIRTQFRKIKPHFILFTFRVPKNGNQGPHTFAECPFDRVLAHGFVTRLQFAVPFPLQCSFTDSNKVPSSF